MPMADSTSEMIMVMQDVMRLVHLRAFLYKERWP